MEQDSTANCAVTPDKDHLTCLAEFLRKPGARLSVDAELCGMCWGKSDALNAKLADIIDRALARELT